MPAPPETDVVRIRKYCRARVPPSFRGQIRIEAAVRGNSVSIYECRPPWHPNLTEWSKVRVAQLRYSPAPITGACTGPTAMVDGIAMTT